MKQCPTCLKDGQGPKPLTDFNKRKKSKDGRDTYCRTHHRKMNRAAFLKWVERNPLEQRLQNTRKVLKYTYGLSQQQYLALFDSQHGRCAICELVLASHFDTVQTFDRRDRVANVDHDHDTGAVRGLLCSECNHGLGRFRDQEKFLLSAVRYLRASATAQSNSRSSLDTTQGEIEPQARYLDRAQAGERRQGPPILKLVR